MAIELISTKDLNWLLVWAIEQEEAGFKFAHFDAETFSCNPYKSLNDYNERYKNPVHNDFKLRTITSYILKLQDAINSRKNNAPPPVEQEFIFTYEAKTIKQFATTIKAFSLEDAKEQFKEFCYDQLHKIGKHQRTNHKLISISTLVHGATINLEKGD